MSHKLNPDYRLVGRLNEIMSHKVNPDHRLVGRLNIYTMPTGDGRDIELCVTDEAICWRRVGDIDWSILVPLVDITPQKGVDYLTEEEMTSIKEYVSDTVKEDILPGDTLPGTFVVVGDDGKLECSEVHLDDIKDKVYIHKQSTATDKWTIVHNLNKHPSVSVVDSAGNLVIGEVTYIDLNSIEIKFTSSFSGKCYLN